MNTTRAPIWNEYIASFTRPTLAIVPKAATAQPVTSEKPAILVSRYLGTRRVDKPDGTFTEREMWSHKCFAFVGYIGTEYARIQDMHGFLTLPKAQVQGLPALAEAKAA